VQAEIAITIAALQTAANSRFAARHFTSTNLPPQYMYTNKRLKVHYTSTRRQSGCHNSFGLALCMRWRGWRERFCTPLSMSEWVSDLCCKSKRVSMLHGAQTSSRHGGGKGRGT
jgi:hypothetical protein